MPKMDRRAFLQGTGVLTAGALTSRLHGYASEMAEAGQVTNELPPPVYEPFEWTAPGLVFSFAFLDKKLRFRSMLPPGAAPPKDIPPASVLSGIETSLHCTGEDPDDHHGLKLTGGSPGVRLVYKGRREISTPTGKRLTIYQSDPVLGLDV